VLQAAVHLTRQHLEAGDPVPLGLNPEVHGLLEPQLARAERNDGATHDGISCWAACT